MTYCFKVEVGLLQGTALSPFLFFLEKLIGKVRQESPWRLMFADDVVICNKSRERVEDDLERWRYALERGRMKVSPSKIKYMCVDEREANGVVRLQGVEGKKVHELKNFGSTAQSIREFGKKVKMQAAGKGWRNLSGVIFDNMVAAKVRRDRQETDLEVSELKMLRLSLGVIRMDGIRNEHIRGTFWRQS